MSLLEKMKSFFTEEYEEDVAPVKKEVMQVKIDPPVEDVKIDYERTKEFTAPMNKEVEVVKQKPTPTLFFDDDDFKDLKPKPKPKIENTYGGSKKQEKERFKPTPIISPVYGILDKNYKKDEIKKVRLDPPSREVTIEDVRKKAFGTLKDDFGAVIEEEHVLNFDDTATFEVVTKKRRALTDTMFETMDLTDEINKDITLEELDKIHEENQEKLEGSELFDLIDSMYESGGEE
jgi:hypothetical protein